MFGLWNWWFPRRRWYALCVTMAMPYASSCTRPQWMTRDSAIDWMLDTKEVIWNAEVELIEFNGIDWVLV